MIQFNGEYYCDRIGHIPIHVRSVYILRHKSQGLGLVTIGLLHYFGDSIQVNVTLIVGKNWALQACEVVWRIFWWFITAWLHKSTLTDLSLRRFLLEYMCTHVKWECKVGLWRVFMIHHRLAPRKYSNRSHPTKIPDRINIPKKKGFMLEYITTHVKWECELGEQRIFDDFTGWLPQKSILTNLILQKLLLEHICSHVKWEPIIWVVVTISILI